MLQRGSRVTSAPFSCPEGGGHWYPVSNAFLNAVKANTRKNYWTGRITTTAGTVYEFDQDGMAQGIDLSFLGNQEQNWVLEIISGSHASLSMAQSARIKFRTYVYNKSAINRKATGN